MLNIEFSAQFSAILYPSLNSAPQDKIFAPTEVLVENDSLRFAKN